MDFTYQQFDYADRYPIIWTHCLDGHHLESSTFQFPTRISPQTDMCIAFWCTDTHSTLLLPQSAHSSAVNLWSNRADDCQCDRSFACTGHSHQDHPHTVHWLKFPLHSQHHYFLHDFFSTVSEKNKPKKNLNKFDFLPIQSSIENLQQSYTVELFDTLLRWVVEVFGTLLSAFFLF